MLKRQLVGSKYGVVLNNAGKNIFRDAYAFPAGDYTIVAPMFVASNMLNGAIVGAGGASFDVVFGGANSGVNIRVNHNANAVQKLTTNNPFSNNFGYWAYFALSYGRTANVATLYMNDEIITLPGTLAQRAASPATTGGVKLYNGFAGSTLALPMQVFNAELSLAQLSKIKNDYKQDHNVTFGVLPAIAA